MNWVYRTYPKALDEEHVKATSDLLYEISEVRRLQHHYRRYGPYAELCENEVFKHAMRSACENEYECKLNQNRGHVNVRLLRLLGIFNAVNAKPPGIGKSAMAIYEVIEDIAHDFPLSQWNGMIVFSLSNQQLVCLANCSKRTIIKHKKILIQLGLLVKVPVSELQIHNSRFDNYYGLPHLTGKHVRAVLERLRG